MKGKHHFTIGEANYIRDALRRTTTPDAHLSDKKRLRNNLRKYMRFYISDFSPSRKGFSDEDFDALVAAGRIIMSV